MIYIFKKQETISDKINNINADIKITNYETHEDIKCYLFNNICDYYLIINKNEKLVFKLYEEDYDKHCFIEPNEIIDNQGSKYMMTKVEKHMKLKNHNQCVE